MSSSLPILVRPRRVGRRCSLKTEDVSKPMLAMASFQDRCEGPPAGQKMPVAIDAR